MGCYTARMLLEGFCWPNIQKHSLPQAGMASILTEYVNTTGMD